MNKRLLTATFFLTLMVTTAALADENEKKRAKPNPWLDCGIGALIFPDDEHETIAAISNIIVDLGSTAVTSATSSPDTCNGTSNVELALFIQRTYPTLEAELAKGRGENLKALAGLVETSKENQFIALLREEMAVKYAEADFAASDDQSKMEALYFATLDVSERIG